MHILKISGTIAIVVLVSACSIQRAQVAGEAQARMVGLTKEQVLACMGPPARQAAEGTTEVWSYSSGNDHTQVSAFGQSMTNASLYGSPGLSTGTASTFSSGFGVASRRHCTVNVVMTGGRVNRVNYAG